MPKFEITVAERQDLPRMREIEKAGWLDAYVNESLKITPALLLEHLGGAGHRNFMATAMAWTRPTHRFLVSRAGDHLAGYGIFRRDMNVSGSLTVEIMHLYVETPSRGQGIGKALLDACLAWAGSKAEIVVNVVAYNQEAIRFYEQHGFKPSAKPPVSRLATLPSGVVIPEIEMLRRPVVILKAIEIHD